MAKDVGLSRRRHGFDSRWEYSKPAENVCSQRVFHFATGPVRTGQEPPRPPAHRRLRAGAGSAGLLADGHASSSISTMPRSRGITQSGHRVVRPNRPPRRLARRRMASQRSARHRAPHGCCMSRSGSRASRGLPSAGARRPGATRVTSFAQVSSASRAITSPPGRACSAPSAPCRRPRSAQQPPDNPPSNYIVSH